MTTKERKETASQKYRRKLRENPELHAQYLSQERARDSKRREVMKGKMETNIDLKILARIRSKEIMQATRKRHKDDSNKQVLVTTGRGKDVLEYIPSNRGKGTLLIYRGYTYAHMKSKVRWYCSKKAAGCKARLLTTADGDLLHVLESEHNHPPPALYRTDDGKVFKL